MKEFTKTLCKGRHTTPCNEYIFVDDITSQDIVEPSRLEKVARKVLFEEIRYTRLCSVIEYSDRGSEIYNKEKYRAVLNLYVTGLTVALIAVLNVCRNLDIRVVLYHYDKINDRYYTQDVD